LKNDNVIKTQQGLRLCWAQRGCDEELWSRCPHAISSIDGLCPLHCNFARCDLPQHAQARGIEQLLDISADRQAAVKECCWYCTFFLDNAPRLGIE